MAKSKPQPVPDLAASLTRGGSYVVGADGNVERKEFTRPGDAKLATAPAAPQGDTPAIVATE